jgi:hypothetical protein
LWGQPTCFLASRVLTPINDDRTDPHFKQRALCRADSLSALHLILCHKARVFISALNITLQWKILIFMLEIHYLTAYLFDFYYMPFISLSEVIDLYFATLWIKRLHHTLHLIFPGLQEKQFPFAFVAGLFFGQVLQ